MTGAHWLEVYFRLKGMSSCRGKRLTSYKAGLKIKRDGRFWAWSVVSAGGLPWGPYLD